MQWPETIMTNSLIKTDAFKAHHRSCHNFANTLCLLSRRLYSGILLTAKVVKNALQEFKDNLQMRFRLLTLTRVSVHLYNTGVVTLIAGVIPALLGNFIPLILGGSLLLVGASLTGILSVTDPNYYYNLSH